MSVYSNLAEKPFFEELFFEQNFPPNLKGWYALCMGEFICGRFADPKHPRNVLNSVKLRLFQIRPRGLLFFVLFSVFIPRF